MTIITEEAYTKEFHQYLYDRLHNSQRFELSGSDDTRIAKLNFESDVELDFRKKLDEQGIDYSAVPPKRPRAEPLVR